MKKISPMLVAAGVLVLLVLVFPAILLFSGERSRQYEIFRTSSPDRSDQLTILSRNASPRTHFFDIDVDPPIIVELKLSGKSDARQTVKLLEDSDLIEEPTVIWKPDSVVVSGLSTRREISVELKRKN